MENLSNKEKAEITYKLLQERKRKRAKETAISIGEYFIDKSIKKSKIIYKKNKFKKCKSGH